MKQISLLFCLFILNTFYSFAQDCPTTIQPANNLQTLRILNPSNIYGNSVFLKENALDIDGVLYDAVFTIQNKNNVGQNGHPGNFIIDSSNNNNFKLDNVMPQFDPWVRYNLTFVEHGSATATNLKGTPVQVNNITLILPDLDGTKPLFGSADPKRNYADVAGYKITGGTAPTVTMGSSIKQQGFLNGGNPDAASSTAGTYTFFRPDIPANNINDDYQSTFGPAYGVSLDFANFPTTGVDLVFGVTRDMAQSSGTLADANRTFFHIFVTDCETVVPYTLPVALNTFSSFIQDNQLVVDWKTLTETNNDKFLIEISKNGIDNWKQIGEVKTKATNGNSTSALDYSFTTSLGTALGLMAIPALLGLFVPGFSRRKKLLLGALAILMTIGYFSCQKSDLGSEINDGEKVFVRITQVDKDGVTKSTSEVKEAVRK